MKYKNPYVVALVFFAILFLIAYLTSGCTASYHNHCRPEFMVGYGDKR